MNITFQKELDQKQDILVLGLFEEDKEDYASFNKELNREISRALKNKVFSKKFGEMQATKIATLPSKKVLLLGLGPKKELTAEKLRRALDKAVKYTKSEKAESFTTNILELASTLSQFSEEGLGRAAAEGLLLANYSFKKYLSKEKLEKEREIKNISLQWSKNSVNFNQGLKKGWVVAEATNYVKDLVNEPAAVVTPAYLEEAAKKLTVGGKVKLRVMNKEEMKKEGLNALLGVSAGSDQPPKLIILEYHGARKGKYTAIVGKGITFDSGGLNLKPQGYIEDMKSDMAGAAAVLGTIKVLAELGLKKNVLGVIPACENMINGSAQKLGDIVRAYNGKTIEIRNTDAEGRMILADALSYVEVKYQPEIIIDLATLTGACVIALGNQISGIMSPDEELVKELEKAGEESYDRVWRLPLLEEYQDYMDGTISDLKNISTRGAGRGEAGAIVGAIFLSKFIEKARWAHIDVAGPAFLVEERDYLQKGGTGTGVRLLSYYFLRQQEEKE